MKKVISIDEIAGMLNKQFQIVKKGGRWGMEGGKHVAETVISVD